MKKLLIKDLWLLSFKERKANLTSFHPTRTLIKGENDVGKSHLIKSIYHSLGAKVKFDSEWINLDVNTLINFSVGDDEFFLYRSGSLFALYNSNKKIIFQTTSITRGLAQKFAEIFDFHLYLADHDGTQTLATPSFMFLPFYIDQDKGWSNSFNSFEDLGMFKAFRSPSILYHTGIKPKEFYILNIEKSKNSLEKEKTDKELVLLDRTWLDQRKKQSKSGDVNVDIQEFKKDIENLLLKLNDLQKDQQKVKWSIVKNNETETVYNFQLKELQVGLKTKNEEFSFLASAPKHIECPLCSTEFDNHFENRLEAAADIGDLKGFENELLEKILELQNIKARDSEKFENLKAKALEVESILLEKKKEILFLDFIKHEGRKEFINELQDSINEKKEASEKYAEKIKSITTEMKKYEDEDRINSIKNDFQVFMKKSLEKLKVQMLEANYKEPNSNRLDKSGSTKPRALLAYYFAILSLVRKYSSSTFSPIIIDSPKQQDPDMKNYPVMLEFILSNCNKDDQLILGVVELPEDIKFDGKIINLGSEPYSLLKSDSFEKAVANFEHFKKQIKID